MDKIMLKQRKISRLTTKAIFLWLLLSMLSVSFAQNEVNATKHKLNILKEKIKKLEENLGKATNKQKFLENELLKTKKQIDLYDIKFKKLQQNINIKEQEISALKLDIDQLNTKVIKIHDRISKYLVEQYKSSNNKKFKLMLNQKNLQNLDKLVIYYDYLIAANKKLLTEFKEVQAELTSKNNKLSTDMQELQRYQSQWTKYIKRLHNDKKYQTTLIKKLNLDINNKQHTLQEYRQNQQNLTKLITKLTKKSVLQSKESLKINKHKLGKPINARENKIKKINQGLIFYADEGELAKSISAGRVVFADWLKGYGLLMIIDHGWGFMSLYGNNLELLKRVGENVKTGENITKIGHSGTLPENGLYFEIRHHGKAMPPKKWLQQ